MFAAHAVKNVVAAISSLIVCVCRKRRCQVIKASDGLRRGASPSHFDRWGIRCQLGEQLKSVIITLLRMPYTCLFIYKTLQIMKVYTLYSSLQNAPRRYSACPEAWQPKEWRRLDKIRHSTLLHILQSLGPQIKVTEKLVQQFSALSWKPDLCISMKPINWSFASIAHDTIIARLVPSYAK